MGNFQNTGKVFITLYAATCDNKSMCNTAKCELPFMLVAGHQFQALKKMTACEKTEGKGLPPIKGEARKHGSVFGLGWEHRQDEELC